MKHSTIATIRNNVPVYVLLLPAVAYFFIFTYYPTILGIIVSFQTYRLTSKSDWVGLKNYGAVLHSIGFWNVVKNTFIIGFAGLAANIVAPVTIALLLNEIVRSTGKKVVQTALFIPHLFGWVVVSGIWIFVFAPDRGMMNIVLRAIGLPVVEVMSRPEWGKPLVVFLMVWKDAGYLCVLYLASIVGIDPGLYESAAIDGAGRFRQAISITLPSIVPTIKVLAILGVTGVFQLFDPIWVLRNGGNNRAIDTIMLFVKQQGLDRLQFGFTSAISVMLFIVILAITLSTQRLVGYRL